MEEMMARVSGALQRADRRLSGRGAFLGIGLSLLIGIGTVLLNVSAGPLSNLNDIGGWRSRLLFLLLCGAAETAVQLLCVRLRPASCGRMLLRQGILLCGFHISLLAINQKTFFYTAQVQPLLRAVEAGGLSRLSGAQTSLSVSLVSFLYLVTRIPVYDLYLVKLLCIASWQALILLFLREAEDALPGLRPEGLLLLSSLLPQAFLSVSCAAQADVFAVLLLAIAMGMRKRGAQLPAAALFGLAGSLCGVLLLAAPLFLLPAPEAAGTRHPEGVPASFRGGALWACAGIAVLFYLLPLLPAVLAGCPAKQALTSPFTALFGLPPYASGSPNLMALFPRASAMEMPEAFLLRRLPALDLETNASPFYTQQHFETLMRGLALSGLAGFAAAAAYAARRMRGMRLAAFLSAAALFAVPGGSMALWLVCGLLSLLLILADREMRLSACLLLFATAAGCCYPVTEEILIRPAYTALLVLAALLALFGTRGKDGGERV